MECSFTNRDLNDTDIELFESYDDEDEEEEEEE